MKLIIKDFFKNLNEIIGINFLELDSIKSKSTSIHSLNADKGLNFAQKMLYWMFNGINNFFPYMNVDNTLKILDFKCKNLRQYWQKLSTKNSPSRMLSNLFWLTIPWIEIKEELNEINILDVGCGSGNYGRKLLDYSNRNISKYNGIDIQKNKNWEKLEKEFSFFRFFKYDGKDVSNYIPDGTNFFITQSAIEHFDEDLTFFKQIRDYIISSKKNVIQINVFPSRVCQYLYRFHGVRQYTPRNISKIIKLFKSFSYSILFNLGGQFCNYLHYKYITESFKQKIGDLRDKNPEDYNKLLYMALKKDMTNSQRIPTFYALVIHSNYLKKVF